MAMAARRSYDVAFKLKAVAAAETSSKRAVSHQFKVDGKRLREWCAQKEKLKALKKKGKTRRKRLKGAGRKPLDSDLEEDVFDWIINLRGRNVRVSRKMIRDKARAMMTGKDPLSQFKASRGWLQLFLRRKSLSLRKKTTVCQKTPDDVIPKLVSYCMHIRKLQIAHKFSSDNIFAMDKTACYMDMPSDTTIDIRGAKSVSLKTTGHEKDHFTVILSARADGKKLKPFIVFKGKGTRLIKELSKIKGVVVKFSDNGWMNDKLTAVYLQAILGTLSFGKRLLVWDAYKCHTSEATRRETSKLKLHTAIVPGGCTKFIQAPDVVWNASFKSHLRQSYDAWLSEPSGHEYTKGGNMKAPSRSLLCEWIKLAWNSIPEETIKNSFLTCAITTNTDGSDDDNIHCFKNGQPCEAGRNELKTAMEKIISARDQEDEDNPFASDIDEEETEENEACIDSDDSANSDSESTSDDDQ